MKNISNFFVIFSLALLPLAGALRAQDAPPPPDQSFNQAPPPDQGGDQASADDQSGDQGTTFQEFYDQLGSQGTWVQTDDYGYVFQPNVSDPDWAPYTDGHWVYTDVGWTWVSDEPWGWATYHYGRWANIDGTGWVWVPGYRWAPAWVSWRYGGGYCGWAPLPPETFIGAEYGGGGGVGFGFHFGGDVDVNFNIGPGCYNFVRVDDFGEGNYRGHYLDRGRNFTVINNTTNITNINVGGHNHSNGRFGGVSVGGPGLAEINAYSRTHVQTVQLTQAQQPGRSTLNGNSLAVFAPRVNGTTARQSRPSQVAQTISHASLNRGDTISKPLQVTRTVHAPAPSEQVIHEAQVAQSQAPGKAKIATEHTTIRTPITQPLTSMKPVETHRATNPVGNPGATGGSSLNNANTQRSSTERSAAAAPFTGEPSGQHSTQHTDAASPFTGEPATHTPSTAQTYHPQTQVTPAQTYHPQVEKTPTQPYHSQTEINHESAPQQNFHPTESAPAQTYHPQEQQHTFHPQTEAPAQTFHPQTEQHQSAPTQHTQAAPAPQVHTQSAPAPQSHPAPSGGGGGKPPGNGGNGQQQGH